MTTVEAARNTKQAVPQPRLCVCTHSEAAHTGGRTRPCAFCSCHAFEARATITDADLEDLAPGAATLLTTMVAMFETIRPSHLRDLVRNGRDRAFKKGDTLMHQGDVADRLYLVISGRAKVEHRTTNGTLLGIAEIGPGEPIGEMSLLAHSDRFNTVTAITDMQTLEITADDVRQVFQADTDVMEAFVRVMQERLRSTPRRD